MDPDPELFGQVGSGSQNLLIKVLKKSCGSPITYTLKIYQLFSWPGLKGRIRIDLKQDPDPDPDLD